MSEYPLENGQIARLVQESAAVRVDTQGSILKVHVYMEITVQKAIDSLPADWKDVVVLKDIEELPYEEIASVLGCEVGTVKSRLHRARMALREKLAGLVE